MANTAQLLLIEWLVSHGSHAVRKTKVQTARLVQILSQDLDDILDFGKQNGELRTETPRLWP